jgi:cysteine synthase
LERSSRRHGAPTLAATVLLVTIDPAEELAPHARVAHVEALREQWGRRWAVDAVVCGEGSGGSVAAVAAVTESGGSLRRIRTGAR